MKNYQLIVLLFLFLSSCLEQKSISTEEIERYKLVLSDLHLAQVAIDRVIPSKKDSVAKLYYQQIYKIHDMDSTSIFQMLNLINESGEWADTLYLKVVDELENRKSKFLEKGKEKEKTEKK